MVSTINIGPVVLHLYGLIISLGIIIGAQVSLWSMAKLSKQDRGKLSSERVWSGLTWGLIGGVIGARIYHVIDQWYWYSEHPAQIIAIWQGGLGIFGGLIGGGLGLYLYAKYTKLSIYRMLDIAALGIPLGQAIGRLGNFVNQELYGYPSQLPWAIYIAPEHRLAGYEASTRFHPLFAYESLGMLLTFITLQYLFHYRKIKFGTGQFIAIYLIGYSLTRFSLEPFRITSWQVAGIPTAQLISLILIGFSFWWLQSGSKHHKP